jgi:predicted aminopeptidase
VDEVITDDRTALDIRQKLSFSKKVLDFASKNGLNAKNSYHYYVHVEGSAISYVVYAAEVSKLTSVTWWFPIVGSVPYLGFFARKDRDEEADGLKQQGYDVAKGHVGAFSSLGWFEDPIYKTMLSRSRGSLAHLLFHELTHRTFWSSGSVTFNENLAEYVSGYLTKQFLATRGTPEEMATYLKKRRDRKKYKTWLHKLRPALEELYQKKLPLLVTLDLKAKTFQSFLNEKFPTFESKSYKNIKKIPWNNAKVLSASLYSPDIDRFKKAHLCMHSKSVGGFLKRLKIAEEDHEDSFSALDSLCKKGSKDG